MKANAGILVRKGSWAVADQILSSGTNFAAGIIVARFLGPMEFGSYVVAYSASMVVLSFVRSFAVDPYIIKASPLAKDLREDMTKKASGLVLIGSGIGSIVMILMAFVIGGPTREALLTMALVLPGLFLQDFWRQTSFASGEPKRAFANDLVWTFAQVCSFLIVWTWFHITTTSTILAWGAGALGGALYGFMQFRIFPVIGRQTYQWMKQIAVVGGWFGITNALYSTGNFIVSILIASICGRSNLGGFQIVNNLFSPSQVVTTAGQAVGLPMLSRAHATAGSSGIRRGAMIYTLIVGGVLTAYGCIILAFGPFLLSTVFGKAYLEFHFLVLPCALVFLLNAWASGAVIGLIAMASGRALLFVQAAIFAVQIPLLILLSNRYGVAGAAWAAAAGAAVRFILIWAKCRAATV